MIKLVFPGDSFAKLSVDLLENNLESCALIFANSGKDKPSPDLLVSDIVVVPSDSYLKRTKTFAQINPDFLVSLIKRARLNKSSVIFCHTHPFESAVPEFSKIDAEGEIELLELMNSRVPDVQHGVLLITPNGSTAKTLGREEIIQIVEVGAKRKIFSPTLGNPSSNHQYDRQIRAFGEDGQRILQSLKVGIVGLGGTGSVVASQLTHLGVSNFELIDPDVVETTNLNRLIGATPQDLGRPKVDVIAQFISKFNSSTKINSHQSDITYDESASVLKDCDFIFCCTDSHASRAVINQLAYQYFIPSIDVGVSISSTDSGVTHITGRAQLLTPGLGCLVCGNLLDGNRIRQELMTEEQSKLDPYFIGEQSIIQPAVISINTTMSSLAVSMFLGVVTDIPASATLQFYDGIRGVVRSAKQSINPSCIVCSKNGALGLGYNWQLPTRSYGRSKI